jgi:hypothetical protein
VTEPDFDAAGAVSVLGRFDVRFVLIGGLAARLHGSPSITDDLDICYARDESNLKRLASALGTMHARLRGVDEEVPFLLDAKTFRAGDTFTFLTDFGSVDCLGTPTGTAGFDELDRNAVAMELEGIDVRVASVDDLISMKRAAGRPKDRVELEILGALREELEGD